jgi:hypothetical protein
MSQIFAINIDGCDEETVAVLRHIRDEMNHGSSLCRLKGEPHNGFEVLHIGVYPEGTALPRDLRDRMRPDNSLTVN